MSPRSYNLGKRKASIEGTRARILEAARKLLADEASPADLSMEAVARAADVSRLTIYYQFESRRGLLEAIYDYMADRGNMRQVAEIFQEPDPNKALEKMAKTFVEFWASDPVVIRRVRAMAALDEEVGAGMQARDSRRRRIAAELVRRFQMHQVEPEKIGKQNLTADVLATLTSFEIYDALARAGHDEASISAIVLKFARATITGE
ncbi:MAG TPA: helix-turn-helix domain-containing protein [Terriglobales bacterium]|nr:helix-turn-helix domain-containing protein [Terriglobales bacterium]